MNHNFALLLMALLTVAGSGCSKADLNQALDNAKAQANSLTESAVGAVQDQLPATGSIALDLSPPVEMEQAQVSVIVIGDDRPNVVQIASYDVSRSNHSYPAVLWHGTTRATKSSELAGQTVEGDMYYQHSLVSPIVMTKPGQSANVMFGSFNQQDDTISASLKPVELISPDEQIISVGGGTITAVVRDIVH